MIPRAFEWVQKSGGTTIVVCIHAPELIFIANHVRHASQLTQIHCSEGLDSLLLG